MRELAVEVVLDAGAEVGEGPVWDPATATLRWVDLTAGVVHVLDPLSGVDRRLDVGRGVGFVADRASGDGIVAALDGAIAVVDPSLTTWEPLAPFAADDPSLRMNDGKVDPSGRLWVSTMDKQAAQGRGSLWCVWPDLRHELRLDGLTIPNGIDWSPDGRTMYYADSPTRRLEAFDFDPDTAAISNRRTMATVDEPLLPDGLTVDAEGAIWVAMWGGWCVHRYAPDGTLDTVVRLPVAQVSSCAFGGRSLDQLYITSASIDLDAAARAAQPLAGAVFVCRPGVTGRPANRFAG